MEETAPRYWLKFTIVNWRRAESEKKRFLLSHVVPRFAPTLPLAHRVYDTLKRYTVQVVNLVLSGASLSIKKHFVAFLISNFENNLYHWTVLNAEMYEWKIVEYELNAAVAGGGWSLLHKHSFLKLGMFKNAGMPAHISVSFPFSTTKVSEFHKHSVGTKSLKLMLWCRSQDLPCHEIWWTRICRGWF